MNRLLHLAVTIILLLSLIVLIWSKIDGYNVYEVDSPGNDLPCAGELRFAVIGDYGRRGTPARDVAGLVKSWDPDFIATVGDNNYPNGTADTIDHHIGRYYSDYIHPYLGQYGSGAAENRFFPALGNHDWRPAPRHGLPQPYLDYFTLPGNERYYELRRDPAHLFIVDSDSSEPDGRKPNSIQARWLAAEMAASDAPWKIVLLHHAPFSSSGHHGSDPELQWDYAGMGTAAVVAGHDHLYERIMSDGMLYFVNGLGGNPSVYNFGPPIPGSAARYNQDFGAMLISAGEACLNFRFYNRAGDLIDSHTLLSTPKDANAGI